LCIGVIASEAKQSIEPQGRMDCFVASLAMTAVSERAPNMPTRQNWFEGWRLFAVLALTLVALSLWIAGMRQFEVDGVRMVIRFTARTSLLFFCLAFSAAALARLWRGCGRMRGRGGSAATAAPSASPSPPRTPSMRSPLSASP
jgi:hypothetical protein